MDTACQLYDALASLLTYPDAHYLKRAGQCRLMLADVQPEAGGQLGSFVTHIANLGMGELEELYTLTFDLNPVCSLEVGWHLYGENYNRGEFLVLMRQLMREQGLAENTELPDHLSNVLRVVGRLDPKRADRFCIDFLLPALDKMLAGVADKDNPFARVLEAIRGLILSPAGAVV